ncbi:MAG TPA: hypothetical protein EYO61_00200, partial [Campylobacterales bacterium]|nr:hypothetical protein [Campylobacterales bacterium]
MLYSSTLFQVGDAKRLYQLFKKNRVNEYFDKKRVGNLTLYRYLDFSKEGENFISIDIKSKEVGDTLKGDEVVQDGKFFNVLGQKSTGELNSVEWKNLDEKSIEDTKIYIVKNYPHQAKQVSEIQKTEYLYKDKYDNIYFPIFLQKFSEGGDGENREIRNYQTLSPEQRHTILKKRWLEKIAPVLKENSIKLQPLQNFAKLNNPQFLVGNGQIAYKNHYYDLVNSVRKNGFYKNLENIHNIVIVNTVRNFDTTFLQEKLLKTFQEFHLNSNIVSENFINWESSNQHEIEHRIGVKFVEYMKNKYDLTQFIPLIIHHKENSKIARLSIY